MNPDIYYRMFQCSVMDLGWLLRKFSPEIPNLNLNPTQYIIRTSLAVVMKGGLEVESNPG